MARAQDEFLQPTNTVIGAGFTIQAAKFSCAEAESMRIDGTVKGDIEIEGLLNISETGRVDGNVSAGSARVAGRIFGNVNCRNTLHLATTADVTGDVLTSAIIVDEGAVFTGCCQTHIPAAEEPPKLTENNS
ncbi:MAG: polymer-forming cytoskeletal protein [Defluviitaleaceae bacterium]|nr:polymer-forming cytoskeletal protein [Defluviitaleaceae bacterium]